jgi:hypothetical protein
MHARAARGENGEMGNGGDDMARLALLLDQSDLSYVPAQLVDTPPPQGDSHSFSHM